jgi:ribose 5-phosphate isomerase B
MGQILVILGSMKVVVSSDDYFPIIDLLLEEVGQRGHEVHYWGPRRGEKSIDWPEVTLKAMEEIKQGKAEEGIILCWTGTGCALVANKVSGIRAALCGDSETAKGARIWNHANVLALSLRLTSEALLKEILKAWFETTYSTDEWNLLQMKRLKEIEKSYLLSQ